MVWDWRVSRTEPMLSWWHDLLFLFWLLLFYILLPSMGLLCGVVVFGLIECSHSLPALHIGLQMIMKIIISWNTRQDFFKIPSRWQAALETERSFSDVILGSNVNPNITRSSGSFSTVSPIVNVGEWWCIVRDLETIIVLVFLVFNFILQRSHHPLTFTRSLLRTLLQ